MGQSWMLHKCFENQVMLFSHDLRHFTFIQKRTLPLVKIQSKIDWTVISNFLSPPNHPLMLFLERKVILISNDRVQIVIWRAASYETPPILLRQIRCCTRSPRWLHTLLSDIVSPCNWTSPRAGLAPPLWLGGLFFAFQQIESITCKQSRLEWQVIYKTLQKYHVTKTDEAYGGHIMITG